MQGEFQEIRQWQYCSKYLCFVSSSIMPLAARYMAPTTMAAASVASRHTTVFNLPMLSTTILTLDVAQVTLDDQWARSSCQITTSSSCGTAIDHYILLVHTLKMLDGLPPLVLAPVRYLSLLCTTATSKVRTSSGTSGGTLNRRRRDKL
jgi:hypothetical protein